MKQLAMLCQYHLDKCFPCPNGTVKNPQTRWRRKGTGAAPPDRRRQRTPVPALPEPGMTPVRPGNNAGPQHSKNVILPAGYLHSHTFLPWAECFSLDVYAQHSQHNTDFDPDMLMDEGTSTG